MRHPLPIDFVSVVIGDIEHVAHRHPSDELDNTTTPGVTLDISGFKIRRTAPALGSPSAVMRT
jgi:hypothetical protein